MAPSTSSSHKRRRRTQASTTLSTPINLPIVSLTVATSQSSVSALPSTGVSTSSFPHDIAAGSAASSAGATPPGVSLHFASSPSAQKQLVSLRTSLTSGDYLEFGTQSTPSKKNKIDDIVSPIAGLSNCNIDADEDAICDDDNAEYNNGGQLENDAVANNNTLTDDVSVGNKVPVSSRHVNGSLGGNM